MDVKNARRVLLLAFLIFLVMLAAVPFVNPYGSLINLDGVPGMIDHWDIWSSRDPLTAFAYLFGDIACHQMTERSLILNGSQMAICARDYAIIAGMFAGFAILESEAVRNRMTGRRAIYAGFILIVIAAAEWCLENWGPVDSAVLRIVTGAAAGIGAALLINAYLERAIPG
ncbi:MAG: DUF2085 domain-containing protein [Candidatus Methanomethylophilaceae archaeon]|nr:DUF2085 domain-containing protein [Candidatus Methanomethylophilaceae archaeon]